MIFSLVWWILVLNVSFSSSSYFNTLVYTISYNVKIILKTCQYGGGNADNEDSDSSGAIDDNNGGKSNVLALVVAVAMTVAIMLAMVMVVMVRQQWDA